MFTQIIIIVAIATTSIFARGAHTLAVRQASSATPASSLTFSYTTYTPSALDFADVSRDGGGGGNLGGRTLMVFSDTKTVRPGVWSLTSNSYAYASDSTVPTKIQDTGSNDIPVQAIPWAEGECATEITDSHPEWCSASNTSAHDGWWIWPNNALVTQKNDPTATEAYAIYNTGLRSPMSWKYNTLVHWTVDGTGAKATRPVQKYITSDFKYQWGWSVASHTDGNVRIFATSGSSLYIAKVPWNSMTDTSKFIYWNGKDYTSDESSAVAIATDDFSNGDVWWSPLHNTWVLVYMKHAINGAGFYLRHSTSGKARGPYSEPQLIFTPPWGPKSTDYCYSGHSYPQFFGTDAKDVLLSWTYQDNGMFTHMAKLSFSV